MIISDTEDSSIQILPTPPREIVDLVSEDVVVSAQGATSVSATQASEGHTISVFSTLPVVTQVPTLTTSDRVSTTPSPLLELGGDQRDHEVLDLLAHFHAETSEVLDLTIGMPFMPTAERYQFSP